MLDRNKSKYIKLLLYTYDEIIWRYPDKYTSITVFEVLRNLIYEISSGRVFWWWHNHILTQHFLRHTLLCHSILEFIFNLIILSAITRNNQPNSHACTKWGQHQAERWRRLLNLAVSIYANEAYRRRCRQPMRRHLSARHKYFNSEFQSTKKLRHVSGTRASKKDFQQIKKPKHIHIN